jgi:hypothetical protein
MLLRRAYAARVVVAVLAARARGLGYRRIAVRMRLPEATVRDWLRAYPGLVPRPQAAPVPVPRALAPRNTNPHQPARAARSARPP